MPSHPVIEFEQRILRHLETDLIFARLQARQAAHADDSRRLRDIEALLQVTFDALKAESPAPEA